MACSQGISIFIKRKTPPRKDEVIILLINHLSVMHVQLTGILRTQAKSCRIMPLHITVDTVRTYCIFPMVQFCCWKPDILPPVCLK